MTAAAKTNGGMLEHARYRRALLDVLAEDGDFLALLTIHDRLRLRGFTLEDTRSVYAHAIALEQSGLASSAYRVNDDETPRRVFRITDLGRHERERLGVP